MNDWQQVETARFSRKHGELTCVVVEADDRWTAFYHDEEDIIATSYNYPTAQAAMTAIDQYLENQE